MRRSRDEDALGGYAATVLRLSVATHGPARVDDDADAREDECRERCPGEGFRSLTRPATCAVKRPECGLDGTRERARPECTRAVFEDARDHEAEVATPP